MLAWPIDNANIIYLLLGLIVLALAATWYLNRRVKTLVLIAGAIALAIAFWLLTLIVPTDRKQIVDNVWAMRRAVLDRRPSDLARHWSRDFAFRNLSGSELARDVADKAAKFKVNDIHLWDFDIKSVTDDKAEVWFRCRAGESGGGLLLALCKADFVKESDAWKLQRIRFFNAVANTDQEIALPVGR